MTQFVVNLSCWTQHSDDSIAKDLQHPVMRKLFTGVLVLNPLAEGWIGLILLIKSGSGEALQTHSAWATDYGFAAVAIASSCPKMASRQSAIGACHLSPNGFLTETSPLLQKEAYGF